MFSKFLKRCSGEHWLRGGGGGGDLASHIHTRHDYEINSMLSSSVVCI